MKYLKILLIIVLLSLPIIAYGVGTITSGDKIINLSDYKQPLTQQETSDWQKSYGWIGKTETDITYPEPNTLNEWFCDLDLSKKVEIYTWWEGE